MKISLFLYILVTATCLSGTAYGQNPPVFSQFFANPYQFNPSYAASNGYTEANVFYRRQWLGIDNTPTVGAINFQAPLGRNVSLGFLGYSDKSVLLSNTSVLATFGYRVRFSYKHHLNFGISAGVGFNNFDLTGVEDMNDPALTGVIENNTYLNGQFGFNYQWKNLNIGFAFPKLFDSKPNSADAFNEVKFDKFDQRFASASYNIQIRSVQITPSVLYRAIDAYQDQLEGMLIATFKNVLWIGGSYREEYGITGFIGLNVKNLLRIGYSYEKATGDIAKVVDGSHEIYIGARLGKRNREDEFAIRQDEKDSLALAKKTQADIRTQVVTEEEPVPETPPQPVEQSAVEELSLQETEMVTEASQESRFEKPIEEERAKTESLIEIIEETTPAENKPAETLERAVPPGYYLVVGVYKIPENALRVMKNLRDKGRSSSIIYNQVKDYYYVYVDKSLNKNDMVRQLQIIKRDNQFFAAWVFTVD